ncbi:hypothetical protein PACTADRAFT_74290 [Pachysolen tannophilus NRRL Y-2460]|uniref:Uncharacterized protein n=1 Tax=Pachysolen tannophilus NRRL Y-2460 TaxID=669874 RepID=A0A1E4TY25_PACTA|nr:hypothetical protein PACTADRAFT_74290 [Pachysolen tannophilus NRRL Y-2460]
MLSGKNHSDTYSTTYIHSPNATKPSTANIGSNAHGNVHGNGNEIGSTPDYLKINSNLETDENRPEPVKTPSIDEIVFQKKPALLQRQNTTNYKKEVEHHRKNSESKLKPKNDNCFDLQYHISNAESYVINNTKGSDAKTSCNSAASDAELHVHSMRNFGESCRGLLPHPPSFNSKEQVQSLESESALDTTENKDNCEDVDNINDISQLKRRLSWWNS